MCDISDNVKDELKKFRFAKNNESQALIRKLIKFLIIFHVLIKLNGKLQLKLIVRSKKL